MEWFYQSLETDSEQTSGFCPAELQSEGKTVESGSVQSTTRSPSARAASSQNYNLRACKDDKELLEKQFI